MANFPPIHSRCFSDEGGKGVLELISAHVRRAPESLAVCDEWEKLTYAELADAVDNCAQQLIRMEIQPGELVALCTSPSCAGIAAMLAIWHIQGCAVNFDPSQPALRQEQILAATGARFIIEPSNRADSPVVRNTNGAPRTLPEIPDAAYIIHTSGSTGTPKGVVCQHSGLHNMAQAQLELFGIATTDNVAQVAPWSADASVFEITLALAAGATLYIASPDDRYPGPPLENFLNAAPVSCAVLTPSVLRSLHPTMLPEVKLVISAGEELRPELARGWIPNRRLFNAYGPTEATIWTMYYEVATEFLSGARRIPLGQPVAGCNAVILNPELQPCAVDEPGELYLSGAGIAAGYLDDDEKTRTGFPEIGGERFFRSGDYAVLDAENNMFFVGREDEQIKLGGLRIELGEVRYVLSLNPAVYDAVVIRDAEHDRLVAYVVLDRDDYETVPLQKELIDWMELRLPLPMVPSLYVPLPELPLTEWGKVDPAALPSPADAVASLRTSSAGSTSDTQQRLITIVAEILQLPDFAADDDLFMLGMTSLTMARLLRRVSADLGVELQPIDVFELPTVASLTEFVDETKAVSA